MAGSSTHTSPDFAPSCATPAISSRLKAADAAVAVHRVRAETAMGARKIAPGRP